MTNFLSYKSEEFYNIAGYTRKPFAQGFILGGHCSMHSMRKRIISRNALNRISLRKVKTSISRNIHTSHGALVGVANAGHNTPFRNHRNGSKAVLLRAHRGCQLYKKNINQIFHLFINQWRHVSKRGRPLSSPAITTSHPLFKPPSALSKILA